MDKFVIDQAEGLRRLIARETARVIAVTGGSGSSGRTTTVVNLAAALAEQGKNVLVIDECLGAQSVCQMLGGLRCPGSLGAVVRGEMSIEAAAARHALGFGVLPAGRSNAGHYSVAQLGRALNCSVDIVLIDAQLDGEGALSPLALHAHDILIVTRVDAQALTWAYVCMKRLHFAHAIGQFRVLSSLVASADDALVTFENLAHVASRYLSVAVEYAGHIAADPRMSRALELARCVVDAFPSTTAASDYRRLADQLAYWPMGPAVVARSPRPGRSLAGGVAAPLEEMAADSAIGSSASLAHAGGPAELPLKQRVMQHA